MSSRPSAQLRTRPGRHLLLGKECFNSLAARLRIPSCRIRRNRRSRSPVLDAELGVDLLEMLVDRARAQAQNLRDVAVGLALAEPGQHLAFAGGEAKLAGEFGWRRGAGLPGESQQELVRRGLAHVVQAELRTVGQGSRLRLRAALALRLLQPLQQWYWQDEVVLGLRAVVVRQQLLRLRG